MKKILKTYLFIIHFLAVAVIANAQKAPMKFGKVDIEDLKMTVYEKDTSAEAVVLCDYGNFNSDNLQFSRHCRIKILKKSGTEWGNVRVRIPSKSVVKARTYNLENNEVEVSKMKSESIFEETTKGTVSAVRFSLPNVKVGSVIEYSYFFDWIPYDWEFQMEIPVIWSELRMYQSQYVKFQKNFFGYEPLSVTENGRWIAKDLPAFRKEPYMNSVNNYLTKFEFEVSYVNIPGRLYKEFTTSWEKIGEVLYEDEDFGQKISGNLFLNKFANSINEKSISDYEKVKEAYEFIKKEITWDLKNSLWAYSAFLSVFNEKEGNSAEINLMLISLLRKMDIKADPVVLSTRSNGILSPIFPSINKLNYVIAQVEIDGKNYFLDATDKFVPFGMLPKKCLNGEAKLIYKNATKSVNLTSAVGAKEMISAIFNLSKDGEITGRYISQLADYAAYDFRKELDEYTSHEEYIEDIQEDYNGLYIDDYKFENIDSIDKPVKIEYDISLENNIDIIGNNMYINPMLFEKIDENPFKSPDRKYPVDFIHPISKRYMLNITIPEGFEVEEMPKSRKVSLPGNKGSFTYQIATSGRNIQLSFSYLIKNPLILSSEYLILKEFYNALINKHSEMIVLKQIG